MSKKPFSMSSQPTDDSSGHECSMSNQDNTPSLIEKEMNNGQTPVTTDDDDQLDQIKLDDCRTSTTERQEGRLPQAGSISSLQGARPAPKNKKIKGPRNLLFPPGRTLEGGRVVPPLNDCDNLKEVNEKNELWRLQLIKSKNITQEELEPQMSLTYLKSSLGPLILDLLKTFTLDEKDFDEMKKNEENFPVDQLLRDLFKLPMDFDSPLLSLVYGLGPTEFVDGTCINEMILPEFLCAIGQYVKTKDQQLKSARLSFNYSCILTSNENKKEKLSKETLDKTITPFLVTILNVQQNFDHPPAIYLILRALNNYLMRSADEVKIFKIFGGEEFLCGLIDDEVIPIISLHAESILSLM